MSFGPWDVLLDCSWMALLLWLGKWLRAYIRPLQKLYVPAAIIAGLLGLVAGPQVLDIIPFSDQIQRYPWLLVVVLFASFPFSSPPIKSAREVFRNAGSMFCFCMEAEALFFGCTLLLGATLFGLLFPQLNDAFALLLPAGFIGGHGYATAIGGTLQNQYGLQGALTIGYTFATIGLLSAILFGIPLIKWGTRRGYTRLVRDVAEAPPSTRTGLLEEDERSSLGSETISASSLDTLTFHALPVLLSAMAGYYVAKYTGLLSQQIWSRPFSLPDMAAAMLCGMLIKRIMTMLGLGTQYLDRDLAMRIGSTTTDWLVCFGIASIKLQVVVQYIWPIVFLCLFGYGLVFFVLLFLAPRMNPAFWFERGIFTFGWTTGVAAMGIALLRVVDPRFRSGTLRAYGLAYTLIAPIEMFIVAFVPMVVGLGHNWVATTALLGLSAALLVLAIVLRYWTTGYRRDEVRPGEQAIVSGVD